MNKESYSDQDNFPDNTITNIGRFATRLSEMRVGGKRAKVGGGRGRKEGEK